jgi:hypothetical protein
MHSDRIQIDDTRLQANLQGFLRTPAGAAILDEFNTPFWLCLIGWLILLIAGMCMLPTIIWTLAGLQALWSVLKFEQFRALGDNPAKHPERLRAIIAPLIIIGPDRKHALALGTFLPPEQYSADWLAHQAAWFGQVYSSPSEQAKAPELAALLKDDMYRPYRRRRVPERDSDRKELYLLDVEVDPIEGHETPFEVVLFAFAADPGEKGEIMQLPWGVTQGAVSVRHE